MHTFLGCVGSFDSCCDVDSKNIWSSYEIAISFWQNLQLAHGFPARAFATVQLHETGGCHQDDIIMDIKLNSDSHTII